MDDAAEMNDGADQATVRCPTCGRIMQHSGGSWAGMTFPGELCSWCLRGHTPGNEAGWLPPKPPDADLDSWFSFRSMTRPDRIEADGTITLRCPPVPRIVTSGIFVVFGLVSIALAVRDQHSMRPWPDTTIIAVLAGIMILIGVRIWRIRIRIRPDRLEMRGIVRSSVVRRADCYRVGCEEWGYAGRPALYAAIQLRDGTTIIPPVSVQATRRAVLALFDLLTDWVADAER